MCSGLHLWTATIYLKMHQVNDGCKKKYLRCGIDVLGVGDGSRDVITKWRAEVLICGHFAGGLRGGPGHICTVKHVHVCFQWDEVACVEPLRFLS
jgi:hypothetical protein